MGLQTTAEPSAHAPTVTRTAFSANYGWVETEARELIAQAYQLHKPERPYPPSLSFDRAKLETLGHVSHYAPQGFRDRVALNLVAGLESLMGLFFREKYDHHAVTLGSLNFYNSPKLVLCTFYAKC